MDTYHVNRTNQMDYNADDRSSKLGKVLPCTDERLDSGIDSMKEDEYSSVVDEIRRMHVSNIATSSQDFSHEPWKDEVSDEGDTYLHLAIIHEAKVDAMKMIELSKNDPFLNKQNYQRQTPLHLAVITEQPEIVERLLKAGCDPQLVDNSGNTALHIACRKGSLTCFSLLTQGCSSQLPAILSTPNYNGQKCFHLVSIHGYLSLVERLVDLGADINTQEQCNGRTALHLAVDLQNLDLVKLLISKGANVNSLTYGGYTPYHLTYGRQNTAIEKELYELTAQKLRELPESDTEDSSEDEQLSEDEEMYDDIQIMAPA